MSISTPFAHLPREAQAAKIDETARRIVSQEVHLNVSGLIGGLQRIMGDLTRQQIETLGTDDDDMMTLAYMQPDADAYREACDTIGGLPIAIVTKDDDGTWSWEWADDDDSDAGNGFESELEAWRDFFDRTRQDAPDGGEIYEHWAISSWLADKLREQGHSVVDDVSGLTVWGRPTTGQMIYMDGVIQRIARGMLED